jgi:hypothetical protein
VESAGLDQEFVRPRGQRVDARLVEALRADDDHGEVFASRQVLDRWKEELAGGAPDVELTEHHAYVVLGKRLNRRIAVRGFDYLIAVVRQRTPEYQATVDIVVDQQDRGHSGFPLSLRWSIRCLPVSARAGLARR